MPSDTSLKEDTMKRQVYTTIAAILLTSCLNIPAKAQCRDIQSVANIPFQFSVGEKTLPAASTGSLA